MKNILILVVLFMAIPIWGMTKEQFDELNFKIASPLKTVEKFSDYYKISEDNTIEFTKLLNKVGMNINDLDNYIEYLSYNYLIFDTSEELYAYDLKAIKLLVFKQKMSNKFRSIMFVISKVIKTQDEIITFNNLEKGKLQEIIFESKDTINDYKEYFKEVKDSFFTNIGDYGFKTYEDLLLYVQNKAISVIKNRWERDFKEKDLIKYEEYMGVLNLDLELMEKNIISSSSEYELEHEILINYASSFGTEQELGSFLLPERALKELSYTTNQNFFNHFKKGDILSIELDHDGIWYKDLDEWLRGYYNHTTLTVKDPYVNLEEGYKIDPTEQVFFSADRKKPVGAGYEQRSKYQYTYIKHEVPGSDEYKLFNEPEPWDMVRSRVVEPAGILDILDGTEYQYLSDDEIRAVVSFAESTEGMPYGMFLPGHTYCSRVTWEAYKIVAGIDLDSYLSGVSFVTPDNIIESSKTIELDYWDYREEKNSLLGKCKYAGISLDLDTEYYIAREIIRHVDDRSYYQCGVFRETVKDVARDVYNNEEAWINVDKLIDEREIAIPDLLKCKNIEYSNQYTEKCLAVIAFIILNENLNPWLLQKDLTCYYTEDNVGYKDISKKFHNECVTDFDSEDICKYRIAAPINTSILNMDFTNDSFTYQVKIDNLMWYSSDFNNYEPDECKRCYRLGKKILESCPEFINY